MKKNVLDPFLVSLGWNDDFHTSFNESQQLGVFPGRIVSQGKGHYHAQVDPRLVITATISSDLRQSAKTPLDYPGVGDWVVLSPVPGTENAIIHRVLKRKSLVQRTRSGTSSEAQLIVTNVDFIFIVTSLNEDFDIERLGRYMELANQSGACVVFVLTKTDLCTNPSAYVDQLQAEFSGVDILTVSSTDTASVDQLKTFFAPGMTTVLLGSSGVGKSTLTNYFLGLDIQKTRDLSEEAKGRHTTTSRNIFFTQWGGLVIDTPGMQEILAFEPTKPSNEAFSDLEKLTLSCKFTNCRHGSDPGCAISSGLKKGTLAPERWSAYLKLKNQ